MSERPQIFGDWLSKEAMLDYVSIKSKTTIDTKLKEDPSFPRPSYALGIKSPRWYRHDIDEYMRSNTRDKQ